MQATCPGLLHHGESTKQAQTRNQWITDPVCYQIDHGILFSSVCICKNLYLYKASAIMERKTLI